jgi:hypothetical protein
MFLRTEFIRILFRLCCFFFYYRRRNDDLLVSLGVGGKMTTYGGEMNVDY